MNTASKGPALPLGYKRIKGGTPEFNIVDAIGGLIGHCYYEHHAPFIVSAVNAYSDPAALRARLVELEGVRTADLSPEELHNRDEATQHLLLERRHAEAVRALERAAETLRIIGNQSIGADWTAEAAIAFAKLEARKGWKEARAILAGNPPPADQSEGVSIDDVVKAIREAFPNSKSAFTRIAAELTEVKAGAFNAILRAAIKANGGEA